MDSAGRGLTGVAIAGYVLSAGYLAVVAYVCVALAGDWFAGVLLAAAGVLPLTIVCTAVTGWRLIRRRQGLSFGARGRLMLGVLLLLVIAAVGLGYLSA